MAFKSITTKMNLRWLLGLSTDPKPTLPEEDLGTMLMESDTGNEYKWTGSQWFPVNQSDVLTGSGVAISSIHAHGHNGNVFHFATKITGLVDTATASFLVRVPTGTFPHVHRFRVNTSSGNVDVRQFEGATVTAPGTAIPTYNTNRNSLNTPSTLLYAAPTTSALGTQVHILWLPYQGAGIGQSQIGISDAEAGEEWILKPDTDYIIRITNNSGATITYWAEMLWYEL